MFSVGRYPPATTYPHVVYHSVLKALEDSAFLLLGYMMRISVYNPDVDFTPHKDWFIWPCQIMQGKS